MTIPASSPDPLWRRIRRRLAEARAFAGRLGEVVYVCSLTIHEFVWRPLYRRR